jgi:hypothetical protein
VQVSSANLPTWEAAQEDSMKALMSTTRKGTPAPSDQISHEGATKRAARGQAYASVKTIGGVTCKDGTVLTATDVQNVIFDHGHGNFFPTHVMEAVNDQICEKPETETL